MNITALKNLALRVRTNDNEEFRLLALALGTPNGDSKAGSWSWDRHPKDVQGADNVLRVLLNESTKKGSPLAFLADTAATLLADLTKGGY